MSNPFNDALDWALQGKRVRVHTDHGVLEGWVDRVHHSRGSLILHDCYDESRDAEIGSAFVRTAQSVQVLKPRKRIEFRAVDGLEPHPAHPDDFEPKDAVLRRCYRNQFAGSYPVVREDGTIINGHKRVAAARLAGMDKHPVEVVDVTDDQADELFALAHRGTELEEAALANGADDENDDADASVDEEAGGGQEDTDVVDGGDEPDDDEVQDEEEDDDLDDDLACDVDGCDFTTDSERGLAIHEARSHDDDSDSEGGPGMAGDIADLLEEHGELPSSEIELLLETSSGHYRNVLSKMQRDGRVESRKDPEDKRRNLYRLADDVDKEESEDDVDDDQEDEHRVGDPVEEPDDDTDPVWCGVCGDGPWDQPRDLATHHGKMHDADDPVPLDHEPDDSELVDPTGGGDTAVQERLPDDVSEEDVHDVVDDHGPNGYLGEIAEDLGMAEGATRTVLVKLGRYADTVDASGPKIGGEEA
ncbi:ParB N-terminal domain-containing protein [Haloarcula pelagica]|uniref:ParB N-terminal domain-containing protein n=1 Tax=Haloarcula pelagica TaxID=3033389 RepID=UPI0024C2C3C2|nr:ParB N-terminal domain-containing protein [Halomicroarcula sp. YJ-61-S]